MAASNSTNFNPEINLPTADVSASAAGFDEKNCSTCSGELKSGMKYQNVCPTCEPSYNQFCGGCQRKLWSCMCIKPHTWE